MGWHAGVTPSSCTALSGGRESTVRTYGFKATMSRHEEITARPVSVRELQRRFQPSPRSSTRALLIRMGPFVAREDAFRFENDFPITFEILGDYVAFVAEEIVEEVARQGTRGFSDVLAGLRIPNPIPFAPDISLPNAIIGHVVERVQVELIAGIADLGLSPMGTNYGRCGGMAFAGYDLYRQGWQVRGFGSTIPAEDSALDKYIHDRLLDSLDLNVRKFLEWVMILHVMPKVGEIATAVLLSAVGGPLAAALALFIGSDVDIFKLGGPGELLDRTKNEWQAITRKLDEEAAWPIGVIYGNKKSPFKQHQVLATDYEDAGLGTATLTIWDNEDGARDRTLTLDFRGDELQESGDDDIVKGIFLEAYAPKEPPESLRLP
jgi:hypothetical protein